MTSVLNINTSGILPFIETEGLSSWEEKALYALRDLEKEPVRGRFLGMAAFTFHSAAGTL